MEPHRKKLTNYLVEAGALRSPHIIDAFKKIDRKDFVRTEDMDIAYENHPLQIGYNQTISQPQTVAFMFELLQPNPGEKILDVGSGSGWTTALLAEIVGTAGVVYGLERISELVEFGQQNLSKYEFRNAQILQARDKLGLSVESPFDKILVSAGDISVPQELLSQLKSGGTMVIPILDGISKIQKGEDGSASEEKYDGFVFVPLIH